MNVDKKLVEQALVLTKSCFLQSRIERMADNVQAVSILLEQALTPRPQFYYNQPVLVSDDGIEWVSALFKGYSGVDNRMFNASPYVGDDDEDISWWRYYKPDASAVSLPNWLPASTPIGYVEAPVSTRLVYSKDRTMYCVIPEPRVVELEK